MGLHNYETKCKLALAIQYMTNETIMPIKLHI